jgi:hypothetical protein
VAADASYGPKIALKQGGDTLQARAGATIALDSGVTFTLGDRALVQAVRRRCTIAEVNAGVTILAAVAGYAYRMIDAYIIAYGGNVGGATGIDLTATLSTSRKLVAFKTAGMTQSTMLRAGTATNGVLLADGASFTANDANTAITLIKDGSDVTTATGVDIAVIFELVAA